MFNEILLIKWSGGSSTTPKKYHGDRLPSRASHLLSAPRSLLPKDLLIRRVDGGRDQIFRSQGS